MYTAPNQRFSCTNFSSLPIFFPTRFVLSVQQDPCPCVTHAGGHLQPPCGSAIPPAHRHCSTTAPCSHQMPLPVEHSSGYHIDPTLTWAIRTGQLMDYLDFEIKYNRTLAPPTHQYRECKTLFYISTVMDVSYKTPSY